MSAQENKAMVRRYIDEVWNKKNLRKVPEFVHPKLINHLTGSESATGPEGIAQGFTKFHAAFPDFNTRIEHLIAEGDLVSVHWMSSGTHKGAVKTAKGGEVPPSNKRATWSGTNFYRIADGKIAEIWANVDALAQAYQLGFVSNPDRSVAKI